MEATPPPVNPAPPVDPTPHAPPAAAAGNAGAPANVTARRIGAGLIDLVLIFLLLMLVGALLGDSDSSDGGVSVSLEGAGALVFFVLTFLYYWLQEARNGQTLGKRLLGIRVRRVDGGAPGYGPAFVRTLLRPVDGFFFYLVGLIAIMVSKRDQRVGDMAAKTVVDKA